MSNIRLHGPLCVIGHPVAHTLSPRIHNAALRALGHEEVYEARDVAPETLETAVRSLVEERFAGFNVTIPHKQRVIPLLDRLDDSARAVGAVNTVRMDRSESGVVMTGYNTDIAGFTGPLIRHADNLRGGRVLVWGAGGAARAVVAGVLRLLDPELVTVVARHPEQVADLTRDLDGAGEDRIVAIPWPATAHTLDGHVLLVNTTPLGMHPDITGTPAVGGDGLRAGQVVYDLVYRPYLTRLLADAGERGAEIIGGLPMLVGQAAEAFYLWTGHPLPIEAVYRELDVNPLQP